MISTTSLIHLPTSRYGNKRCFAAAASAGAGIRELLVAVSVHLLPRHGKTPDFTYLSPLPAGYTVDTVKKHANNKPMLNPGTPCRRQADTLQVPVSEGEHEHHINQPQVT